MHHGMQACEDEADDVQTCGPINGVRMNLHQCVGMQEMVPLSTLESGLPLAVALANERKKGDQSEFWPHLRLLPTEPPSLWLKTTAEQSAFYDTLGQATHYLAASQLIHMIYAWQRRVANTGTILTWSLLSGWPSTRKKAVIKQLRAKKCRMENHLDTFLTKTKLHSLLGLTRDEVMWGLSTVSPPKSNSWRIMSSEMALHCNCIPNCSLLLSEAILNGYFVPSAGPGAQTQLRP